MTETVNKSIKQIEEVSADKHPGYDTVMEWLRERYAALESGAVSLPKLGKGANE